MQIKVTYVLTRQDIDKLPIEALACYCLSKDEFNSGTQQRARNSFFTEDEKSLLEKLITKAEAYYRHPTQTMEFSPEEYIMLNKVGEFLDQYWVIH